MLLFALADIYQTWHAMSLHSSGNVSRNSPRKWNFPTLAPAMNCNVPTFTDIFEWLCNCSSVV